MVVRWNPCEIAAGPQLAKVCRVAPGIITRLTGNFSDGLRLLHNMIRGFGPKGCLATLASQVCVTLGWKHERFLERALLTSSNSYHGAFATGQEQVKMCALMSVNVATASLESPAAILSPPSLPFLCFFAYVSCWT